MKRVLIAGKSGYIASSLFRYLHSFPEEYEAEAISLRDGLWKALDFSKYDVVVHCAGLAHVKETKDNAQQYYQINRDLTISIAEKAKAEGVKQLVFLSSLSVYGKDEGVLTPETIPMPRSAYAKSKLEAEKMLQIMETDAFHIAILRPPMVYGPDCPGNYRALVKLAKALPVVPSYTNQRSAVSIARLCEYIKGTIDKCRCGVFVPQDEEYLCTCAEITRLAEESGRKVPVAGALNPAPELLRRFTRSGRKAFGDLIYKE